MRITARRLEPPYINPWNSQTKVFTIFSHLYTLWILALAPDNRVFTNLSIGGSPHRTTAGAPFHFFSVLQVRSLVSVNLVHPSWSVHEPTDFLGIISIHCICIYHKHIQRVNLPSTSWRHCIIEYKIYTLLAFGTESHDEPTEQALLSLTKKTYLLYFFLLQIGAFMQLFSFLSFPKSHVGVPLIPPKVLCSAFLYFDLTGHGSSEHDQGRGEAWCSQGALHVLWLVLSLLKCENGEFFAKTLELGMWLDEAEMDLTESEQVTRNQCEVRGGSNQSRGETNLCRIAPTEPWQSPRRLISMPRRKRPIPNRSLGTKA